MVTVTGDMICCEQPHDNSGYGTMRFSYKINGNETVNEIYKPQPADIRKFANVKHPQVIDSWLLPGHFARLKDGPEQGHNIPFLVVIAVDLAAVAISVGFWKTPVQHWKLARRGAIATGMITSKSKVTDSKGMPSHSLSYKYARNGGTHHGTMEVSGRDYANASTDDTVTVLYDPKHPADSIIYHLSFYLAKGGT